MDIDFFNAEPQDTGVTYEAGRQPPQQTTHIDGQAPDDFGDFQHPAADQPSNLYQNLTTANQDPYAEIAEIDGDSKELDVLQNIRQQEQQIQQRLVEKARVEAQLKQERKVQGRRQLQQFFSKREKQMEEARAKNRNNPKMSSGQNIEYTPWQKITANIALKEGEYPGKRDIARMRQALVNKRNDG